MWYTVSVGRVCIREYSTHHSWCGVPEFPSPTLVTEPRLISSPALVQGTPATPHTIGLRGPVPRRRFQRGSFIKEPNGGMYSMHYIDAVGPDGSIVSKQVKRFLGNLSQMSERAARAEHAKLMVDVNLKRGSVRPVPKGQTLADAVTKWRAAISPNLSPATVRPRESFLRTHIMPRFGRSSLQDLGVHEVQQFATDLRQTVSGKRWSTFSQPCSRLSGMPTSAVCESPKWGSQT